MEEKSDTVKKLEDELKTTILENQINIEIKKTFKNNIYGKITIGSCGIIAFITVTFVSLQVFSNYGIDSKIYPVFSLLAGAFTAYIVLMVSGIIKEFTIKGGTVELSTKLQEQIKSVQDDVKETKKDFLDKYERLMQNVNTRIDNVITNANSNVNQINLGDIVESISKLAQEQKAIRLSSVGISENIDPRENIPLSKDVQRRIDELSNMEERLNRIMRKISSKSVSFDSNITLQYANYLTNVRQNDKALEILNEVIEKNPQNKAAWHNKGVILSNIGRNEEALSCFEKAIELDPLHIPSWRGKGVSLRIMNRLDEALVCFKKAVEIDPEYVLGLLSMSYTLEKMGRKQEAVLGYEKILENIPKDGRDWDTRGFALLRLNRLDEALPCFEKAIELEPNRGENYYDLSMLYAKKQNKDKSLEYLKKAIELDPLVKTRASNEEFFDQIKNTPEFIKLIT